MVRLYWALGVVLVANGGLLRRGRRRLSAQHTRATAWVHSVPVADPETDVGVQAPRPARMPSGRLARPGELLLIDGNSLAYRAFFALPDSIATADGFPTNALYGLAAMMMKVLPDERPARVVVAWDAPGKTFRHEAYPEYKAGRQATPDLLREQSAALPAPDGGLRLHQHRAAGVRGRRPDRHPGPAGRGGRGAGHDPDRRPRRLPAGHRPGQRPGHRTRGDRHHALHARRGWCERYGVGARADDRPAAAWWATARTTCRACPGIGEKGAAQLLAKYGDLDERAGPCRRADAQARARPCTAHVDDARQVADAVGHRLPTRRSSSTWTTFRRSTWARSAWPRSPSTFERFEFESLARRLPRARRQVPARRPGARRRAASSRRRRRPRTSPMRLAGAPSAWPSPSPTGAGRWPPRTDAVLTGAWDAAAGAGPGRRAGRGTGGVPRRQGRAAGAGRGRAVRRPRHDDRRLPARAAPPRLPARRARRRGRSGRRGAGGRGGRRGSVRGPGPRPGRAPAGGLRRRGARAPVARDRAAAGRACWPTWSAAGVRTRRPPPRRDRRTACATAPTSCATGSGRWPAASS